MNMNLVMPTIWCIMIEPNTLKWIDTFIKENLDNNLICTPYVSTQNQLANILTKDLNCINFEIIIFKLGMENVLFTNLWESVKIFT